ncbi:MAG: diadenylate cyclase CdaA [Bacteroidota bacterium]
MELFKIGFLPVTIIDVIDIVLVAFIFYKLYMMMRGTIAAQIFVGLILIMAFSFITQAINMKAMGSILRTLTEVWVIAFIVLFQPEIRRVLVHVGRNPVVRMFLRLDVEESIEEIAGAAGELSKKRHGALMVIVRATGLRTFVESGIQLQARVSRSLLLSIFNPKSPLHDGAVIIKDRIIEASRCTLPLSLTTKLGHTVLGMRHRAGLGISEQADVLSVIVSEETGGISLAENGVLTRDLTVAELRKELKDRVTVEHRGSWKTVFENLKASG